VQLPVPCYAMLRCVVMAGGVPVQEPAAIATQALHCPCPTPSIPRPGTIASRKVPATLPSSLQDGPLGPGWVVPELQFLDKNSKFRVQGRTVKSFRFLARAVARDPITGTDTVLAQVESEPFKVRPGRWYQEHLLSRVQERTTAPMPPHLVASLHGRGATGSQGHVDESFIWCSSSVGVATPA
jgi:hypothetical protein